MPPYSFGMKGHQRPWPALSRAARQHFLVRAAVQLLLGRHARARGRTSRTFSRIAFASSGISKSIIVCPPVVFVRDDDTPRRAHTEAHAGPPPTSGEGRTSRRRRRPTDGASARGRPSCRRGKSYDVGTIAAPGNAALLRRPRRAGAGRAHGRPRTRAGASARRQHVLHRRRVPLPYEGLDEIRRLIPRLSDAEAAAIDVGSYPAARCTPT